MSGGVATTLTCLILHHSTVARAIMVVAPNQVAPSTSRTTLSSRYFDRLSLDARSLDSEPTVKKLQILQERHLATIPFENGSQHGLSLPATLDLEQVAHKILDCRRGGFCFELNGLFSALLSELGYQVTHVPGQVFRGSFGGEPTHLVNIVRCRDGGVFVVDVAFGEPPIHPLQFDVSGMLEQVTPEGMQSKLQRHLDDSSSSDEWSDVVVLYWKKGGEWVPRLRWSYPASLLKCHEGPSLSDFAKSLELVLQPDSNFAQKLIYCRVTQDQKITLAGHKLKITGSPRFPDEHATVSVELLESPDAVRQVLLERFGIPWQASEGLDLSRSLSSDPSVWSQK